MGGFNEQGAGKILELQKAVKDTWAAVQEQGDEGLNWGIMLGWRGGRRLEDSAGVRISRTMLT